MRKSNVSILISREGKKYGVSFEMNSRLLLKDALLKAYSLISNKIDELDRVDEI